MTVSTGFAHMHRQRRGAGHSLHRAPHEARSMGDLNTTPLIDVMLVLLIMFIVTIPLKTHKVAFDLPQGAPPQTILEPTRNLLLLDASGQAYWNAQPVSDSDLREIMEVAALRYPDAELHFRPDPQARYERVDELLATAKRAGTKRLGFVGNERYAAAF